MASNDSGAASSTPPPADPAAAADGASVPAEAAPAAGPSGEDSGAPQPTTEPTDDSPADPPPPQPEPEPLDPAEAGALPAWPLALALIAAPPALWLAAPAAWAAPASTRPGQLALLLAAAVAIGLGALALGRLAIARPSEQERAEGLAPLLVILALATMLRLVNLGQHPVDIHPREAGNALMALELTQELTRSGWRPVHPSGIESLYLYGMALPIELGGVSPTTIRLFGALLSVLTVLALFVWTRELFGPRAGLIAAALAAVVPWSVDLGRAPCLEQLVALLATVGCFALWRAIAAGGWWRYLLAGLLLGLSAHSGPSFRHGLPLAVAFLIVHWRRFGGGDDAPRQLLPWGLAVLLVAALGAAGTLVPAALDGDLVRWQDDITERSLLVDVRERGELLPIVVGRSLDVLPHALLLRFGRGLDLALLAGLAFCAGLPLLTRRRDPRMLLLLWFGLGMLLPPLLSRGELLDPARYAGLMPVLFPLAALTIHLTLARLGRAQLLVGLLLAASLAWLTVLQTIAIAPSDRQPSLEGERLLRAAIDSSVGADAAGERLEYMVYVPPQAIADVPAAALYLRHPRVATLVDNDLFGMPLPAPELDIRLLASGGLARALRRCFPWRVEGEFEEELGLPGLSVIELERPGLEALRQIPSEQRPLTPRGFIHIPRSGRWRVSIPAKATWQLGQRPEMAPGSTLVLPLARGLLPYRRRGGAEAPQLEWLAPSGLEGQQVPAASFWALDALPGPFRSVPCLERPESLELVLTQPLLVTPPPTEEASPNPEPQVAEDLAVVGRHVYSALGARVTRVDLDTGLTDDSWPPGLETKDGPLTLEPARRGRTLALAPAKQGVWVAYAPGAWVARFGPDGWRREQLRFRKAWQRPIDVASHGDGRVAVADAGLECVVVFGPRGRVLHVHAVEQPVAIAWGGDRLIVLEGGSGQLRILPMGGPQPRHKEVAIGAVSWRARLIGSPAGDVVALLPAAKRLRWFDSNLALYAPGGEPAPLDALLAPGGGGWAVARGELLLVEGDRLVRARRVLVDDDVTPGDGLALGPASGGAGWQPLEGGLAQAATAEDGEAVYGSEASLELAVPAEAKGPHAVWVRMASVAPRPLELRYGKARHPVEAWLTPGLEAEEARWIKLLVLELDGGKLELRAPDGLPRLYRVRLVPE